MSVGNNITCSTDCRYRTAATLYMYPRNAICFRYITVNTCVKVMKIMILMMMMMIIIIIIIIILIVI